MHNPVLLQEVLEYLQPKAGGVYVDGTIGYGGHAEAMLQATKGKIILIGTDRDEAAVEASRTRLAKYKDVRVHHAPYSQIPEILKEESIDLVDGILLDLGASSPQFDNPERGFSFTKDGPLDMRFDLGSSKTAAEIVNTYPQNELVRLLFSYGEERQAKKIARAIVQARKEKPFVTTSDLAFLIEDVISNAAKRSRIHPATKTFQALRIEVNSELDILQEALPRLMSRLKQGGRIGIISFHSLEDRIVKEAFKYAAKDCICPKDFPVCRCKKNQTVKIITKKPVIPTKTEIKNNVRSRSAKLRVAERL